MSVSEGHHVASGQNPVLVEYTAMAVGTDPRQPGPMIGAGLAVACCPGRHGVYGVHLTIPVREAGRLIACIEEYARRHGMGAALTAAVDQGREWARAAPAI